MLLNMEIEEEKAKQAKSCGLKEDYEATLEMLKVRIKKNLKRNC